MGGGGGGGMTQLERKREKVERPNDWQPATHTRL